MPSGDFPSALAFYRYEETEIGVALQLCLPWQFGLTPFVQWCTFSYLPMKTRGDRVFAHEFAVGGEA